MQVHRHSCGWMGTARAGASTAGSWPTGRAGGPGVQPRIRATAAFGSKCSCRMRRLIFVVLSSRRIEIARLANAVSRRGSEPRCDATVVLAQGHGPHPVDAVLDAPVATVQRQQSLRRRPWRRQTGQQVHGVRLALAAVLLYSTSRRTRATKPAAGCGHVVTWPVIPTQLSRI